MKVKNRIFTVIIVLVCFFSCLFTCKPYDAEEAGEIEYTNVVYSPEINSVTIYLDGQVPVPRSLNRDIAMMGCDYFEVTFLYQETATTTKVARGEWMAGRTANVNGVERGVDYSRTSTALATGQGSAILFAGKSDKTLMAVGRLYMVNGTAGTIITNDTKSVTFRLSAISASAATPVMSGSTVTGFTPSSFKTSALVTSSPTHADAVAGNTVVIPSNTSTLFATSTKPFPLFKLEYDREVKAVYTFDLYPLNSNSFNAYSNGIFISTPAFGYTIPGLPPVPPNSVPAEIERKQPRYTEYNGTFHQSILMLDEKTVVLLENNNTPGTPFEPDVKFTFYTELTIKGSVFSLVFSIPVYALTEEDQNGNKSRWYIRSSYGPGLYDLDDGTQGMGGAVLIGTGTYSEPDGGEYAIKIETPPDKWRYNILGINGEDRVFNIDGLVVDLITSDGTLIREIPYTELTFRIGLQDKYGRNPTWTIRDADTYPWTRPGPSGTPYIFPSDFYGCIEISVEYYHPASNQTYYASFYLLVATGIHEYYNIPSNQIAHIYDNDYISNPSRPYTHAPWNTFPGTSGGSGTAAERFQMVLNNSQSYYDNKTIVIIVHNSFNIDQININTAGNNSRAFFIVAADENNPPIVIGRGGTGSNLNSIVHQMENPGLNSYYFGVWPFPKSAIGDVNTKPFTVNTQGAFPNANTANSSTFWMIKNNETNHIGSGIYNVKVNGATILPTIIIPPAKPGGRTTYEYPLLY